MQDGADFAQKLISGRAIEIANRAAEEQDEDLFAFAPARRHLLQAIEIGALEADDADPVYLSELLPAAAQSAPRNINRVVVHALLARQGF